MEKRRLMMGLVVAATFLGGITLAAADAPAPPTQGRKKKPAKPRAPKVSLKCASDADCVFITYDDGACCPMLCQPRAVARTSAEAIEKYAAACKKPEGGCPVPECAPSPIARVPACVSGKCEAHAAPAPARE